MRTGRGRRRIWSMTGWRWPRLFCGCSRSTTMACTRRTGARYSTILIRVNEHLPRMRLAPPSHELIPLPVPHPIHDIQNPLRARLARLSARVPPPLPVLLPREVRDHIPGAVRPGTCPPPVVVVLVRRHHVQRRLAHAVEVGRDAAHEVRWVEALCQRAETGRDVDDACGAGGGLLE